jgi:hypothetical protein
MDESKKMQESGFSYNRIGDIGLGRPNLAPSTSVAVYRLIPRTSVLL